ncbi:MobH family relaxase [Marinobacter goseongensis]|uniref:MobH family relaxase n=1 Tax=Marinobacter goseongensis TaxID=453838 RepID=UPI002005E4E5|nr:MobH family relaxase [Marinobacter goseongensis]MCK7553342.1 TraI domain-containing protein [Marinobacter goseongensis]
MFSFITRLFDSRNASKDAGPGSTTAIANRPTIPRYPPYDDGFPAVNPSELLDSQARLIEAIDHEMGMSPGDFDQYVRPILTNYAAFVHLLPASKAHHHRGPGGLFRHGLEVANHALRSYHGRIIDGHESGQRRKELESRWRIAVLAAALGHDLGKPAIDMTIFDRDGKKQWDVFSTTIVEWMDAQSVDRYYIRWTPNRVNGMHENLSLSLLPRVVPPNVFDFLKRGDPKVISTLYSVLSGTVQNSAGRVISELVHKADQASVAADLKGQRIAEDDTSLGVPAARFLVDAMKRLVSDGHWKPNQPKQPLWVSADAAYLDWDMAASHINRVLDSDDTPGVPRTPDAMAQALIDYDVLEMCIQEDDHPGLYVRVAPEPLASTKAVQSLLCVRLRQIGLFFDGPDPAPVECHVGMAAIAARKERNKERAEEKNANAHKRAKERDSKRDFGFKVNELTEGNDPRSTEQQNESAQDETNIKAFVPSGDANIGVNARPDNATVSSNEVAKQGHKFSSSGDNALNWYRSLTTDRQILVRDHLLVSELIFWHEDKMCVPHPEFIKSLPKDVVPMGVGSMTDWLYERIDKAVMHYNVSGHRKALIFTETITKVLTELSERRHLISDEASRGRGEPSQKAQTKHSARPAAATSKRSSANSIQPKRTPLKIKSDLSPLGPKIQALFESVTSQAQSLETIVKDASGVWIAHEDLIAFSNEHHPDIPERFLKLQLASSAVLNNRTVDGVRQVMIGEI